MAKMIAKLPSTEHQNARNLSDKKEIVQTLVLVGADFGPDGVPKYTEPVRAVFYMGRSSSASMVDCALWVSGLNFWTSGKGRAGGYGYHKQSGALDDAIISAGIRLLGSAYGHGPEQIDYTKPASISGVGDAAMAEALYAIAEALGYHRDNLHLVRT